MRYTAKTIALTMQTSLKHLEGIRTKRLESTLQTIVAERPNLNPAQ